MKYEIEKQVLIMQKLPLNTLIYLPYFYKKKVQKITLRQKKIQFEITNESK